MNYQILVNKNNKIPDNFKYNLVNAKSTYKKNIQLDKEVFNSFIMLKAFLKLNNINIDIESGFRTHTYQKFLFDECKKIKGTEYANKYVAHPYHSEHETGYALDFLIIKNKKYYIEHDIINLLEIKYIHENLHKFGFILRYPFNKENITGYSYECWHIRYVGIKLAKFLFEKRLTLEEYYDGGYNEFDT